MRVVHPGSARRPLPDLCLHPPGLHKEGVPAELGRQRHLLFLPEAGLRDGAAERRGQVLPPELLQVFDDLESFKGQVFRRMSLGWDLSGVFLMS